MSSAVRDALLPAIFAQGHVKAIYNVPIVMDSLVGSIESDMGIKAT